MCPRTSWQADGPTALLFGTSLLHENPLGAEPPEPEMSRLAGGGVAVHAGAEHGPVVSHYGCEEQRDAHQDHGERQPDLQGFALVHLAPGRRSQRSSAGDSRGLPRSWRI